MLKNAIHIFGYRSNLGILARVTTNLDFLIKYLDVYKYTEYMLNLTSFLAIFHKNTFSIKRLKFKMTLDQSLYFQTDYKLL